MPYLAPVNDYRFLMDHVAGFGAVTATARFADTTPDLAQAILTEAAKLSTDVLAPLNRVGDQHPARLDDGQLRTPPGFASGYHAIADGGWIGMSASAQVGGMGLPMTLTTCVNEMLAAACLALQINPLMTQGQIETLEHHGSDQIKAVYLPHLISGAWSGTMNLTEPQAGSDVGALRTKAVPNGDGSYAITGQKIYISWADNDFSANVCHLVLARLSDAPAGSKGISLFMVPKLIPDADGNLGAANQLRVVSLEHKLGLHGSPTAVMDYAGATGWLVGAPHGGLAAMFTMMNNARLGVATQGIGVAERAFQHSLLYAQDRIQGRAGPSGQAPIIAHMDVRRMLAVMRAEIYAARGIALMNAVAIDMATATQAPLWAARAALLTPISKAYGSDTGVMVTNLAVQLHGGMGVIEDSGIAQLVRDVRVTTIYEGTNGIQAMDLVGRKMQDEGEAAFRLIDDIVQGARDAQSRFPDLAEKLWNAAETLRETTEWLVAQTNSDDRFAGAVPYLAGFARVLGGHVHLASALAGDASHLRLAQFYIRRLLPEHAAVLQQCREGAADLAAISAADLGAGSGVAR
jgi:acyl-CoA dehydrogenase